MSCNKCQLLLLLAYVSGSDSTYLRQRKWDLGRTSPNLYRLVRSPSHISKSQGTDPKTPSYGLEPHFLTLVWYLVVGQSLCPPLQKSAVDLSPHLGHHLVVRWAFWGSLLRYDWTIWTEQVQFRLLCCGLKTTSIQATLQSHQKYHLGNYPESHSAMAQRQRHHSNHICKCH